MDLVICRWTWSSVDGLGHLSMDLVINRFLHLWYTTACVNSTGKTNSGIIAPCVGVQVHWFIKYDHRQVFLWQYEVYFLSVFFYVLILWLKIIILYNALLRHIYSCIFTIIRLGDFFFYFLVYGSSRPKFLHFRKKLKFYF